MATAYQTIAEVFWVYELIKSIEQPCEKGNFIIHILQKRKEKCLCSHPAELPRALHYPEPQVQRQQNRQQT